LSTFSRFFSGIEKTVNLLRQGAIEGAQRNKRDIEKPMFAASLHQLGNAALAIDIHHDE